MFDVSADAYGRFMGRLSEPLARELMDARRAFAEHPLFDGRGSDLVVAQLVVPLMEDPVAGLHEMSTAGERASRAGAGRAEGIVRFSRHARHERDRADRGEALRQRCADLVGPPPLEISGSARCVVTSV